LTVANFETPAATRHAVQSAAVAAMVTGFGYVFLGAALLTAVTVFSATFDQKLDHISGSLISILFCNMKSPSLMITIVIVFIHKHCSLNDQQVT
jgi:hypothetical protein